MFCGKCGKSLKDEAEFCPACGAAVQEKKTEVSSNNLKNKEGKKSNKKIIIVLLSIFAVLLIVVGALLAFYIINSNKEASLKLDIKIADYNPNLSTRLPVNIQSGEDTYLTFIFPEDNIQLKNGEYTFSFPASPLCDNGNFYSTPNDKVSIIVKDGQTTDNISTVNFNKINAKEINESDVYKALDYAKKDDQYSANAEKYAQNTIGNKNKALKDEADQKKAQEDAAKQKLATKQFVSGIYESKNPAGYILKLDVENLKYSISQNGKVVDEGTMLDKAAGEKYIRDEAVAGNSLNYGVTDFVIVTNTRGVSMANRYLSHKDNVAEVSIGRKHDAGGAKP